MAAKPDAAATLNELEAFLRQPDAVLEPTIVERLKEYVMCHGQPQQAVEYLTDGYQGERRWSKKIVAMNLVCVYSDKPVHTIPTGYAQMAVLMCQWLASATAGGDDRSTEAPGPPLLDGADCLRVCITRFVSIFKPSCDLGNEPYTRRS